MVSEISLIIVTKLSHFRLDFYYYCMREPVILKLLPAVCLDTNQCFTLNSPYANTSPAFSGLSRRLSTVLDSPEPDLNPK